MSRLADEAFGLAAVDMAIAALVGDGEPAPVRGAAPAFWIGTLAPELCETDPGMNAPCEASNEP